MSGMKEDGGSGDGERTKVAGGQNGFGFNDFHRVKARKYISMCNSESKKMIRCEHMRLVTRT
jgi:hypothetical protein